MYGEINMKLKKLYKQTTTGATQQYEIIIGNDSFYTIIGKVGGKLITSKPTMVTGKNIGRSNETSIKEQVILEAKAKWQKNIDKGYTEDINAVATAKKYFDPMLAHKYNNYKNKIKFPVLASPKIDGCRMVAQKNGLYTRNGKPYVSCPHIVEALKPFFDAHPDWVIDGEVYSHNQDFEKIISLVKKSKPTPQNIEDSKRLVQYWVFDGVTDDKTLGFEKRFQIITNEIIKLVTSNKATFTFVPTTPIHSHTEIINANNIFVSEGYEGVILRVPNSAYENKRSKNLLKYKTFLDEEFKILDIIEGTGNRAGMAGNLTLEINNGKTFNAGIKGGEDYYKQLLIDKNKYIGKLATIRYQNLSKDGIPRFPVAINIAPFDR